MDVSKTTPTAIAVGRRGERKTRAKYKPALSRGRESVLDSAELLRQSCRNPAADEVVITSWHGHHVLAEEDDLEGGFADSLLAVNVVGRLEPGDEVARSKYALETKLRDGLVDSPGWVIVAVAIGAGQDAGDTPGAVIVRRRKVPASR